MYNARPGLLIGFHGCDRSRQQLLLQNSSRIPMSTESYEWLGHGFYFWENNYDRAFEWAKEKKAQNIIDEPAVIGAVIDLMYCCDLLDSHFIKMVAKHFDSFRNSYELLGMQIPKNRNIPSDPHEDELLRYRDCAIIQYMHQAIRKTYIADITEKGYSAGKFFDSVRGVFTEGDEAFEGAGFSAKSHIQICIRNPNCIKGFFTKREEIDFILQETGLDPTYSKYANEPL